MILHSKEGEEIFVILSWGALVSHADPWANANITILGAVHV